MAQTEAELLDNPVAGRPTLILRSPDFHSSTEAVAALVAIGGCFVAAAGWLMRREALVPRRDPGLADSPAFENV